MPAKRPTPTPPPIPGVAASEIGLALDQLAASIAARHPAATTRRLILIGIANGGVHVVTRLQLLLRKFYPEGARPRTGILDISFHRDDIDRNPIPKEFTPTIIPIDVTGATVILVDDVLQSGRTVKAALDELFDHGRPAKVELAVLVDRGGRTLPVAADYTGITLATAPSEKVTVVLHATDPRHDAIRVESAASKH
ncbi:MAG: bifunctional pyr operon transcriptional regulator/uracil phosphoribosyltransferase PyrR [Verrucomicrobia bacterium]|nr:bifunctional pyr operon transcriptional regulator/uracil phosphoribosyltransferase PyrR [Verrucomicrobiota bacterium]